MNDGNCNTGTATGFTGSGEWVATNLGQKRLVNSIRIGYDRNTAIYGGWGPGYSVSGGSVGTTKLQGSNDNTTWTDILTLPSYASSGSPSDGLATISVNAEWTHLRMLTGTYFALTEFQVDVKLESSFFAMF